MMLITELHAQLRLAFQDNFENVNAGDNYKTPLTYISRQNILKL